VLPIPQGRPRCRLALRAATQIQLPLLLMFVRLSVRLRSASVSEYAGTSDVNDDGSVDRGRECTEGVGVDYDREA
jgi:hypothetical protein